MALSNGGKWALGLSVLYAGVLAALLASKRRLARNPRREDETSFRFLEKAYGKPKPFDWRNIEKGLHRKDPYLSKEEREEYLRYVVFLYAPYVFYNDPMKLARLEAMDREGRINYDADPRDILRGKAIFSKKAMILDPFRTKRRFAVAYDIPWEDYGYRTPRGGTYQDVKKAIRRSREIVRSQSVSPVDFVKIFLEDEKIDPDVVERVIQSDWIQDIRNSSRLVRAYLRKKPIKIKAFPGAGLKKSFLLSTGVHPKKLAPLLRGRDLQDYLNSGDLNEADYILGVMFARHRDVNEDLREASEVMKSRPLENILTWFLWIMKSNRVIQLYKFTPTFSYDGKHLERVPLYTLFQDVPSEDFAPGKPISEVFERTIRNREQDFANKIRQENERKSIMLLASQKMADTLGVPPKGVTLLRTPDDLSEEGNAMHHCVGSYSGFVEQGHNLFHIETSHGAPTTLHLGPAPEWNLVAHLGKYNREPDIWARAKVNLLLRRLGKPRHYLKNARARAARRRRGR